MRSIISSTILTSILATGLFFVAGWLATDHLERLRLCEDIVERVQSVSSRWSFEVSNIRSQPAFNYDSLVALSSEVDRLLSDLASHARASPHASAPLRNSMKRFHAAVASQYDQVERFKISFSVLHNSTRYLPVGISLIHRSVSQLPVSDQHTISPVLAELDALSSAITVYRSSGSQTDLAPLRDRIQRLRSSTVHLSPDLAASVLSLISHAQVIITQSDDVLRAFRKVTSPNVRHLGDTLVTDLRAEHAQVLIGHRYAEAAILVCAVLIVLVWLRVLLISLLSWSRAREARRAADASPPLATQPAPAPAALPTLPVSLPSNAPPAPSSFDLALANRARNGDIPPNEMIDVMRSLLSPLAPDCGPDPIPIPVAEFISRVELSDLPVRTGPGLSVVDSRLIPAVQHLLANALQSGSLPEQVTLSIAQSSNGLVLTVRDRGAGMDPASLSAAQSLFHTTRPDALGLGLCAAARVCELAQARFILTSRPGLGTLARILIPGWSPSP